MKKQLLVQGHTLWYEGRGFHKNGCTQCGPGLPIHNSWSVGGQGHGKCSCGAMSEHLTSGAARQRWHRAHKEEISQ